MKRQIYIAAALAVLSCRENPREQPAERPKPDRSGELYSLEQIQQFELSIDAAGLESLAGAPKTYVAAEFRHGDVVLSRVGVKIRGSSTLATMAEKPSLEIKFNKFVKGQRFAGLESLTLNNQKSDPTLVRELLCYGLFRDFGLVAPQVGYAEVAINGQPYGLYSNVETIDDPFLARNFDNPRGNLYEANDRIDLDRSHFDQDEGGDHSFDDVRALNRAAASLSSLSNKLPRDHMLRFLAAEVLVGHADGYTALKNYYLYSDPAADRWTMIPWSVDLSLRRRLEPYWGQGLARKLCFEEAGCRRQYTNVARELAGELDANAVIARLDRAAALIGPAHRRDPRRYHTPTQVGASRERLRAWLAGRTDEFVAGLDAP